MKKILENKKILVLLFRAHDRLVLDESFVFSVNNSPKNTPLALLPYENSRNSQYDTQYIILTCEYTGLLRLLLQVPKLYVVLMQSTAQHTCLDVLQDWVRGKPLIHCLFCLFLSFSFLFSFPIFQTPYNVLAQSPVNHRLLLYVFRAYSMLSRITENHG